MEKTIFEVRLSLTLGVIIVFPLQTHGVCLTPIAAEQDITPWENDAELWGEVVGLVFRSDIYERKIGVLQAYVIF